MTSSSLSSAVREHTFQALVHAASNGHRCPENNGPEGVRSDAVVALARAGRLVIEIYGHNFRVVRILQGPHAGKSTAPAPSGRLWKIIDQKGTRRIPAPEPQRREPSAPRSLSRDSDLTLRGPSE